MKNIAKPTKLIRYEKYKEVQEELKLCYEETSITGEPHCASIEAPTGGGKTTLLKDTVNELGLSKDEYLYIGTPDNPTPKSIISAGLETIGDPAFDKIRHLWEGKSRLKRFVIEKGIKLVVWDDFQHFASARYMSMEEASEYLKTFIKDTGVTCFVTGIEGEIETVLDSNSQLSRLFETRESVGVFAWEWGVSSNPEVKMCQQFFGALELTLGLHFMKCNEKSKRTESLSKSDSRQELIYRIMYSTQGITANVVNLVRRASREASIAKSHTIELEHLSKAFTQRIEKHVKDRYNPFELPLDTHFDLGLKEIDNLEADKRKLNDVLSTK